MTRRLTFVSFFLLLLSGWALAQTKIVPTPPKFVQPQQLPGEDQFSIARPTFSPKSDYLAAFMHSTKKLTVWETATAKIVAEVAQDIHGFDGVDGLEFSNDGKALIMLRGNQPLTYIDWKGAKVMKTIALEADPQKINSYDFNSDQSLLVLGTRSKGLQVWNLKTGKKSKQFLPDQGISGVDYIAYKTKSGKTARKIAWGRAVAANTKFEDAAGIIDLDSGTNTTVLRDLPADKLPPKDAFTFILVDWQWGGGHLMVSYFQFPPKIQAGIFHIDATTHKTVAVHKLSQKTISLKPKYLWKPYYGLSISSADMSAPMQPYKTGVDFIVSVKEGLKTLDTIDQTKMAVQTLTYNRDNTRAAVVIKKSGQEKAQLFLYKVTP